ncbi:MAG: cytochrome c oxidase subunit II [Planctomycetes bacterium]|nr:cytochrome c oxidase subunit II [Planctomycetota bacterium]
MIHLVPNLLAVLQSSSEQTPEGSLFFPPKASNFAAEADWLYNFIFWVSVVAFALVIAATVYLVVRYRKSVAPEPQPSPHHSTKLEVIWSVIPSIFLVVMFWKGFELFVDYRKVPAGAYQIQVEGVKWNWTFRYPTGAESNELHVPMGEPVELLISSKDVLHSVFIPAFRVKQDAVPGRYTRLWFEATMPGEFPFYCTEYCGTSHSGMITKAKVYETRAEFDEWLKSALNPYEGKSPAEAGALVWERKGCKTCHTNDGSNLVGPSFKGIWGATREFEDGSTGTVDENYILESIQMPAAKIVKGYQNVMVANGGQELSDEERDFLVAYITSLAN